MILRVVFCGVCLILAVEMTSCSISPERRYKQLEKEELSSGVRYDSLFMGLYLNMSRADFRKHCYDLHLEGKFKQGGRRSSIWVQYEIPNEMSYPGIINFYPNFVNDTISELNASIYYDDVEFRDHTFESDSLLLDVLNLMDSWYGGEHYKIPSPFFYKEDVYVKINGNRRITIYPDISGNMINLWFVDLTRKVKR